MWFWVATNLIQRYLRYNTNIQDNYGSSCGTIHISLSPLLVKVWLLIPHWLTHLSSVQSGLRYPRGSKSGPYFSAPWWPSSWHTGAPIPAINWYRIGCIFKLWSLNSISSQHFWYISSIRSSSPNHDISYWISRLSSLFAITQKDRGTSRSSATSREERHDRINRRNFSGNLPKLSSLGGARSRFE